MVIVLENGVIWNGNSNRKWSYSNLRIIFKKCLALWTIKLNIVQTVIGIGKAEVIKRQWKWQSLSLDPRSESGIQLGVRLYKGDLKIEIQAVRL